MQALCIGVVVLTLVRSGIGASPQLRGHEFNGGGVLWLDVTCDDSSEGGHHYGDEDTFFTPNMVFREKCRAAANMSLVNEGNGTSPQTQAAYFWYSGIHGRVPKAFNTSFAQTLPKLGDRMVDVPAIDPNNSHSLDVLLDVPFPNSLVVDCVAGVFLGAVLEGDTWFVLFEIGARFNAPQCNTTASYSLQVMKTQHDVTLTREADGTFTLPLSNFLSEVVVMASRALPDRPPHAQPYSVSTFIRSASRQAPNIHDPGNNCSYPLMDWFYETGPEVLFSPGFSKHVINNAALSEAKFRFGGDSCPVCGEAEILVAFDAVDAINKTDYCDSYKYVRVNIACDHGDLHKDVAQVLFNPIHNGQQDCVRVCKAGLQDVQVVCLRVNEGEPIWSPLNPYQSNDPWNMDVAGLLLSRLLSQRTLRLAMDRGEDLPNMCRELVEKDRADEDQLYFMDGEQRTLNDNLSPDCREKLQAFIMTFPDHAHGNPDAKAFLTIQAVLDACPQDSRGWRMVNTYKTKMHPIMQGKAQSIDFKCPRECPGSAFWRLVGAVARRSQGSSPDVAPLYQGLQPEWYTDLVMQSFDLRGRHMALMRQNGQCPLGTKDVPLMTCAHRAFYHRLADTPARRDVLRGLQMAHNNQGDHGNIDMRRAAEMMVIGMTQGSVDPAVLRCFRRCPTQDGMLLALPRKPAFYTTVKDGQIFGATTNAVGGDGNLFCPRLIARVRCCGDHQP